MAEDPRIFLHFKTLAKFNEKLADGTINPDRHVVFIKQEKMLWCRGEFYSDYKKLDGITHTNPDLLLTKLADYKYRLRLSSKQWDATTRTYKDKNKDHNILGTGGIVLRSPLSTEGTQSMVIDFSPDDCADKVLVTPVINPTWSFTKQDGTAVTGATVGVSNVNAANITVETGYKVKLSATFKWTHENGKKDPTSTNGSFGTTLPASGVNSAVSTKTGIVATTTYTQNLVAPKKGFMLKGDDSITNNTTITGTHLNKITVIAATGNDTTSASVKVTFGHRRYNGVSAASNPTAANVTALGATALATSKSYTVTGITTTSTQYYVYAYPQAMGALTQIIQDGATPITNAFKRTSVNVVNAAGATIPYYVYTSVNPGAFNNAKIAFS